MKTPMKRIFVCSPLAPRLGNTIKDNIALVERLCHAVVVAGFAPYAPHAFFPHFLSDTDPAERDLGRFAGLEFLKVCHEIWVYTQMGISSGMNAEIELASSNSIHLPILFAPKLWTNIKPRADWKDD